MTLLRDARAAAETALPALKGTRWGLYAILALIALGGALTGIWWVFVHPFTQKQKIEQSKVDAKLGEATGTIAVQAIPQINEANRQKVLVDVQVQKGTIDVRSQPDAGTSIRGVSDAVIRANCMHQDLYAADSACIALHEDTAGVGVAGRDAGGTERPD